MRGYIKLHIFDEQNIGVKDEKKSNHNAIRKLNFSSNDTFLKHFHHNIIYIEL